MSSEALITRQGNRLNIKPPFTELLTPQLTYTKRIQDGGNSKLCTYARVNLFDFDRDGGLVCPSGFTYRVSSVLRSNGVKISYLDLRTDPLSEPVIPAGIILRDKQDDILVSVLSSDCGVIEAPTGAGKSFLMRMLCSVWPRHKVIICTYSASIIRQTYAELREMFPSHEIGLIGDGTYEPDRRITCTLDRSLRKCDLEHCRVFMYDECHRAAAEHTKEAIAYVQNARMYAFSASPLGRSDGADLETEAMFGPRICNLSYEEVKRTGAIVPIAVKIFDTSGLTGVEAATTTALERRGLWRNQERNQLVAEAVRWAQAQDPDAQILVSVKTVEHAVYLAALLPDFALVYATMNAEKRQKWEHMKLIPEKIHPITAQQKEQFRLDFRAGILRRAVATGVWGTGVDFPGLEVLVRADGQSGPIQSTQIPGRVSRATANKDSALLIDFDDLHNPTLAERAKRRMALYRKKGWEVARLMSSTSKFDSVKA